MGLMGWMGGAVTFFWRLLHFLMMWWKGKKESELRGGGAVFDDFDGLWDWAKVRIFAAKIIITAYDKPTPTIQTA